MNVDLSKKLLVTTPIFYPNAKPHLGHLFTSILADTIKRINQLKGVHTILSTGTDEHGIKMMKTAQAIGMKNVKTLCDINAEIFKEMMKNANISYNVFTRTTEG